MTLQEKIKHYGLTQKDWFQHSHYTILTRTGIDKVQAIEKIEIKYEAIHTEPTFCVIKAIGKKESLIIETFGSAKFGGKEWDKTLKGGKGGWIEHGNTTTWYIAEMAEKRAMSRVVLKITGFYELGVFGEDESEDFKKKNDDDKQPQQQSKAPEQKPQAPAKKKLSASAYKSALSSEKVDVLTKALTTYDLTPEQLKGISGRIAVLNKKK